jgi:histidinol-phosphate aminotransferase
MLVSLREFFKTHIQAIRPYEPGKPIKELEREMGLRRIIKLASNENALGPSRKALRAIRRALTEIHLYPEGSSPELLQKLSEELGVGTNQLVIGNGSNELIELLGRGFLTEGDEVISSECSFLVYPILTQVCGAKYINVPMLKDYRYDLKGILNAITDRTRLIFIANPNNPTGSYVTQQEVEEFIAKVPKHIVVCFDEAYVDFVEAKDFPHMLFHVKTEKPNIFVIRTFSKAYGLAGLRVGYGIGAPDMIAYLHKIRQPFNVNAIAQTAAAAALGDRFFVWRTKFMVSSGRKFFYKRLRKMGLEYVPSQANFVLINTGRDANEVFQTLLRKGMIIRSMKSYGLSTWIRVTIGRRSENAAFFRLLRGYLKDSK